jgi:hypothetical protein
MRGMGWRSVLSRRLLAVAALTGVGMLVMAALTTGRAVAAPPEAEVRLEPSHPYPDSILRGSAGFFDSDGDAEGASRYRWLVSGTVPQTMQLPLDGDLLSTDGEAPLQSSGLAFSPGRYGQALQCSATARSRLAYRSAGRVDPNEGSLELWVQLAHNLTDAAYAGYPRLFSYVIDSEHQLYVEVNRARVIITSRNSGRYYGTWPERPGWRAGEWHHRCREPGLL